MKYQMLMNAMETHMSYSISNKNSPLGDILNTFEKTFVDIQEDMILGDSQTFGTTISDRRWWKQRSL